jgi:hypothetical protein
VFDVIWISASSSAKSVLKLGWTYGVAFVFEGELEDGSLRFEKTAKEDTGEAMQYLASPTFCGLALLFIFEGVIRLESST